ncbi:hypothetical protein HX030_09855 [Myroides odoratimimus]|uniref:hypothetical protein n=1 Tax=Myroides odoratimimus TaxID=76832 RepID=UPI002579029E|nr:hypothetical protein [Myroides odoratimimus]MDM1467349.1 hypothetical protein [Myroides odoratimimus]
MKEDIFRLAAVLYADNNYEVSTKTLHRKVIESVFIDNKNDFIGLHSLIDKLKKQYNLDFTEEEIYEIVSDPDNFNTSSCKIEEVRITLTTRRFESIKKKIVSNNLDYFIEQFHYANNQYELKDLKAIIHRFLYEIFQTNISSFSKLVDPSVQIKDLININDHNLNNIEIEIINTFLNWENDDKNKMIFDISNLALEYCLITNKKGTSFKLENLKNKNFYLDTNVIFRAIGINGENRKNRTLTFLEKFKEAKEVLLISKYTIDEIKNTLDFYIDKISRHNSVRINSDVFNKFAKNQDFVDYYHNWRKARHNDSIGVFKAHVFALIDELKKNFGIKEDYKEYFDNSDAKINDIILDMGSQINTFKSNNRLSNLEASITDAKNIYVVKLLRNGNFTNIFDCKYYFISSDQLLRKWEYSQSNSIPIVLLPSQWMSILLRYLNRTNDDFKSFVSFLNISNGEKGISNEKLHLILSGISEMTSDFTQQGNIISEMIQLGFRGIIEKNSSDDDIVEKSKQFAKTKLELDIEKLQKDNEKLQSKFGKYQEDTSSAIETLKQTKDTEKQQKDIQIARNHQIRQRLINAEAKLRLSIYKRTAYYCIPIAILCVIYFILLFLFQSYEWNMIAVYVKYANSLEEGSIQKEYFKWLSLLPGSFLIGTVHVIYKRLFNKENLNEILDSYKDKYAKEIDN